MARIADQVAELARPAAEELGLELWDVEYVKEGGNRILRVYIDREEGISHSECQAMSERLDTLLDQADLIPESYYLEVSSPGAERPLRDDRDFERYKGKKVLLKTYAPVEGKKEWAGELLGKEDGVIRIQGPKGEMRFSMDQVSKIRLTID